MNKNEEKFYEETSMEFYIGNNLLTKMELDFTKPIDELFEKGYHVGSIRLKHVEQRLKCHGSVQSLIFYFVGERDEKDEERQEFELFLKLAEKYKDRVL